MDDAGHAGRRLRRDRVLLRHLAAEARCPLEARGPEDTYPAGRGGALRAATGEVPRARLVNLIALSLLLSITAYSTAGGVDFGAGIWDLLAGTSARGREARALIDHAMAPVWEVNNVWLAFGIVPGGRRTPVRRGRARQVFPSSSRDRRAGSDRHGLGGPGHDRISGPDALQVDAGRARPAVRADHDDRHSARCLPALARHLSLVPGPDSGRRWLHGHGLGVCPVAVPPPRTADDRAGDRASRHAGAVAHA